LRVTASSLEIPNQGHYRIAVTEGTEGPGKNWEPGWQQFSEAEGPSKLLNYEITQLPNSDVFAN
jgi:hypothetical protein